MKTQTIDQTGEAVHAAAEMPHTAGVVAVRTAFRTPAFMIPDSYQAVEILAAKLVAAQWVPKSYREKDGTINPAKVEVAILHGLDVGLPALAAVQNIAVINGMPAIWGDAMLALVESSSLMEDASEVLDGEGENLTAVCTYKRRGRPTPIVSRYSVAMARKAGLLTKDGAWQTNPSRMLKLRSRGFGLRDGFSDVLKGLRMAEEVIDGGDFVLGADGVYTAPPAPTKTSVAQQTMEAARESLAEAKTKEAAETVILEGTAAEVPVYNPIQTTVETPAAAEQEPAPAKRPRKTPATPAAAPAPPPSAPDPTPEPVIMAFTLVTVDGEVLDWGDVKDDAKVYQEILDQLAEAQKRGGGAIEGFLETNAALVIQIEQLGHKIRNTMAPAAPLATPAAAAPAAPAPPAPPPPQPQTSQPVDTDDDDIF